MILSIISNTFLTMVWVKLLTLLEKNQSKKVIFLRFFGKTHSEYFKKSLKSSLTPFVQNNKITLQNISNPNKYLT